MPQEGEAFSHRQRFAWLRLIRTGNIGPQSFHQLLKREGSAEAALDILPHLSGRIGLRPRIPSVAEIEDELAAIDRMGGRLVCLGEPDYPFLLNYIHGPPPVLTVAGNTGIDLMQTIAIVGARNASSAGRKLTQMLAQDLGEKGYTVVSGLARGIDAAAHRASLQTGTVAVLAGGLDRIYPEENIPLAHEIVDNGGLLLTEMPIGWQPRARDFPRRNRLVSGLSLGVLVVEAARRSGSLITARLALEQNREVFAIPGSPLDPRAEGGNTLIQQGARLVLSAADIVETLSGSNPARSSYLFEPEWDPAYGASLVDAELPGAPERDRLLSALSYTPVAVDELVTSTGLGVSAVLTLLLTLDLEDRVEWSSGQLVALRA